MRKTAPAPGGNLGFFLFSNTWLVQRGKRKKFLKRRCEIRIFAPGKYIAPRKAGSFSEPEVLQMQKAMGVSTGPLGMESPDEDVVDTLIAISVVSKRLAEKLRKKSEKEKTHEQNE